MNAARIGLSHQVRRLFWRGAAAATGLALAYRSRLRWVSVGLLAAGAFVAGQAVGRMLLGLA